MYRLMAMKPIKYIFKNITMKLISIIASIFICFTQMFSQNNVIAITYTPAITRLRMNDVKQFGDNVFMDTYKVMYDSKKPEKSAFGYNWGFTYQRKIKRISLELGIFYTVLRTNSGNFFQIKGITPDISSNYGGIEYNLTYLGLEAPLNLHYEIYKKERLTLDLSAGTSFNLMGQFRVEEHLIQKASGVKFKTGSHLYISDPRLDVYLSKLKEKRTQRIAFCIGLTLDYKLYKHLSISTMPIIKYYSNALEKSYGIDALRADAFLFGLQSQINFNF